MRKFTILIISLLVIITGCSFVRIDTTNIDSILNAILTKSNKLYNQVGQGYKYYVPAGVTYVDNDGLNNILYCDGSYYYLYINIVDYYYGTQTKYKEDSSLYYSKKIDPKDGFKYEGYLEIRKQKDNMYKIEFVYNYSKIEAVVEKENINTSVLNISYILSTIKYNHNVIGIMINDDNFKNKTGKYNNYKTTKNDSKFKLKVQEEPDEG